MKRFSSDFPRAVKKGCTLELGCVCACVCVGGGGGGEGGVGGGGGGVEFVVLGKNFY